MFENFVNYLADTVKKLSVRKDTVRGVIESSADSVFDMIDENGVNWQLPLTLDDSTVQSLLSSSKPSPFGDLKKKATVIDPSVRLAQEIVLTSLHCHTDLLERIRGDIETEWGRCVRLEPYKINIYGPGGKFKRHVDTSRGDGHLGSLVIQFHHSYFGGELVVFGDQGCFNSASMEIAADVDDEAVAAGNEISEGVTKINVGGTRPWWIAFFSDQLHEIFPVYSGTRLTLCFHVWLDFSRDLIMNPMSGPSVSANSEVEEEIIAEINKVQKREFCVAIFFLEHKYSHFSNHNLKGKDMALFRFLRSRYVTRFSKFKLSFTSVGEDEPDVMDGLECETFGYSDGNYKLFDCWSLGYHETDSQHGGNTGNEYEPGFEIYENGAISIHVGWENGDQYFPVKRLAGSDLSLSIDDIDDVSNSVDDLDTHRKLFGDLTNSKPKKKKKRLMKRNARRRSSYYSYYDKADEDDGWDDNEDLH